VKSTEVRGQRSAEVSRGQRVLSKMDQKFLQVIWIVADAVRTCNSMTLSQKFQRASNNAIKVPSRHSSCVWGRYQRVPTLCSCRRCPIVATEAAANMFLESACKFRVSSPTIARIKKFPSSVVLVDSYVNRFLV